MRIKEIIEEAVKIWKENPSMDYIKAIEKAKDLYEGGNKNDTRRSN